MPRTTQTVEQLKNTALTLQASADDIAATAALVAQHGFESLDVRNYDQCRRAMEYVENYTSAVKAALREARAARGDFGGTPTRSVSASGAKTPKKPGTKAPRSGHRTSKPDTNPKA